MIGIVNLDATVDLDGDTETLLSYLGILGEDLAATKERAAKLYDRRTAVYVELTRRKLTNGQLAVASHNTEGGVAQALRKARRQAQAQT